MQHARDRAGGRRDFTLIGPDATHARARPSRSSRCARLAPGAARARPAARIGRMLRDAGLRAVARPPPDAVWRPRPRCGAALRDDRRPRRAEPDHRGARGVRAARRDGLRDLTPASTTRRSCARPSRRPTSSSGTAATTTCSFFRPDLISPWLDPLRPGHELDYHPGEANLRTADVVVINKVDSATHEAVAEVRRERRRR